SLSPINIIVDVGKEESQTFGQIFFNRFFPRAVKLTLKQTAQLARYFHADDDAKFAILTNGINYRFFTDLDRDNKLDKTPFFEFDITNLNDRQLNILYLFAKNNFNEGIVREKAQELVYRKKIQEVMANELSDPSDEFVRFLLSEFHEGRKTRQTVNEFRPLIQLALYQLFSNPDNEHFKQALKAMKKAVPHGPSAPDDNDDEIITTEDEQTGYQIVKSIVGKITNPERVIIRDTKSYCGVLLDNNNRKAICRLHFNRSQKYLGLFDDSRNETRVPIQTVDEIHNYTRQLQATVKYLDTDEKNDDLEIVIRSKPDDESSVLLSSGSTIALTKSNPGLNKISIALGWNAKASGNDDFDLDSSVFLLEQNNKLLSDKHFIFYNNLTAPNGSIQHMGDNLTGSNQGDDEVINITLNKLDAQVMRVVIAVTIHDAKQRQQNFGMVKDAFIRVVNYDNNKEIARYNLTENVSLKTAMFFGEFYRLQNDWKFRAIGKSYPGGLDSMLKVFGSTSNVVLEKGNSIFDWSNFS
ncbi:TerD family protein, partial [Anaerolineales bacterium HSG25]|nr:TerD family protein [Anaerolineales bacterium HSG25]